MKKPATAGFIFPKRGGNRVFCARLSELFGATDPGHETPSDTVTSLDYMVVRIWPIAEVPHNGIDVEARNRFSCCLFIPSRPNCAQLGHRQPLRDADLAPPLSGGGAFLMLKI